MRTFLGSILVVFLWSVVCGPVWAQATTATRSAGSTLTTPEPTATPLPPAANPINLTISPITLFLTTDPGKPTSAQIKIQNNNTETEFLNATIATFEAAEDGDKPILRDMSEADEFKDWLRLSESSFAISPGEWKNIDVTFSPPAEASLSYYYALVFERAVLAHQPGGTSISGAPALLVLTTVQTPFAVRKLDITSFRAVTAFVEYLPQTFEVKIRNNGNVHTAPTGDIFIHSSSNKNIALLPLNPKKSMILPGTERTFTIEWQDGFPLRQRVTSEQGSQTSKTVWDLTKINSFRLGKYTAHVLMVYDDGQRDVPVETKITFWVLPWKLLLGAATILVLFLLGIRSVILSIVRARQT